MTVAVKQLIKQLSGEKIMKNIKQESMRIATFCRSSDFDLK